MKTAISLPDRVFHSAEQLATQLGVSRSELYSKALAALIEKHRHDLITTRLNEIHGSGEVASSLDRDLAAMQCRSLRRRKW